MHAVVYVCMSVCVCVCMCVRACLFVCLFVWEGEPVSTDDYRFRTPGSSRSFLPLLGDWNLIFILGIAKRRIESVYTLSKRLTGLGGYIYTM